MSDLKRRDFVKGTLAAAGALGLSGRATEALAEEAAEKAAAPPIALVRLGKTDARIPRLVAGTALPLSLPYIKRAIDLGVTAFDLADCYNGGQSERIMGKFLEKTGLRKDMFLVTKSCPHEAEDADAILTQSLERMKIDTVDLYFLHNVKDPDEFSPAIKAKVEEWKKQGKIRFFGFSSHAPRMVEVMNRAAEIGWVDACLFKYNFRDYDNDALNAAIDACKKADIGLISMKTQGAAMSFAKRVEPFQAKGFNQHQAVLQAVWADKRIDASVSAMKGFQQLEENAASAQGKIELGAADLDALRRWGMATDDLYCRGCEQHCTASLEKPVAVADTLRYLMYHDEYDEPSKARRLFQQIPRELRDFRGVDFSAASRACPYRLDLGMLMGRAADTFAV
jgi:predicted aldo/keto reductase-like oxidoreductase